MLKNLSINQFLRFVVSNWLKSMKPLLTECPQIRSSPQVTCAEVFDQRNRFAVSYAIPSYFLKLILDGFELLQRDEGLLLEVEILWRANLSKKRRIWKNCYKNLHFISTCAKKWFTASKTFQKSFPKLSCCKKFVNFFLDRMQIMVNYNMFLGEPLEATRLHFGILCLLKLPDMRLQILAVSHDLKSQCILQLFLNLCDENIRFA